MLQEGAVDGLLPFVDSDDETAANEFVTLISNLIHTGIWSCFASSVMLSWPKKPIATERCFSSIDKPCRRQMRVWVQWCSDFRLFFNDNKLISFSTGSIGISVRIWFGRNFGKFSFSTDDSAIYLLSKNIFQELIAFAQRKSISPELKKTVFKVASNLSTDGKACALQWLTF